MKNACKLLLTFLLICTTLDVSAIIIKSSEGGTHKMLGSSWTPMTLQAIPNDGYKFVSWELYDRSKDQVVWNKTELTIKVSGSYVNCYLAGLPATHENSKYTLTAYFEKTIDPTWQILYTSSDGNVVTPYVSNFGANIVSNEYKDGQGIITLDGPATRIGNNAFKNCSSLKSITIPNSVTTLDMYAFESCTSLTSITIPEGVISIGEWTFYNCTALNPINLPDNLASIGDYAFYFCSALTSITLPESLTSIGKNAFEDCSSLTSITIPNGITSIADYIFNDCSSLSSITLHEGVTSIGQGAFAGCTSLTSFTIPEGITKIAKSTFNGCSALTSITIPEGVTSIDGYAFWSCPGLTYIISKPTTPPTCGNNAFWGIDNMIPVYVPCGCVDAYKWAMNWKFFKNFQSSGEFALAVHSSNDTWGQVSITQPTAPYVGFTATADNSSIKMRYGGTLVGCIPTLEYSYDAQTWQTFTLDQKYNVEKGQTFYMRGNNPNGVSRRFDGYSYFIMEGSFEGTGNIMSLVDPTCTATEVPDYCFYRLFQNCTALTKAPNLTATTVNYNSYASMFTGCTNLSYVAVDFENWDENATVNWLSNVSSTGTFVKPSSLSTTNGTSYIPNGWTIQDGGTGGSSTGVTSGVYTCDESVILTATPNECYRFSKWSDGNTDNPRTVTVNGDATYTAEFVADQFTITVQSDNNSQGTVSVEKN